MDHGRVTIESGGGRIHSGSWRVEGGLLTVSSSVGIKSTPIARNAPSPAGMARTLLRELVVEARPAL
jgi:hypothetical protein